MRKKQQTLYAFLSPLSPEATCVPVPGRAGHNQGHHPQRAAALPAVPPAHPSQRAAVGGPAGRGDPSGGLHQRGLQQQREE